MVWEIETDGWWFHVTSGKFVKLYDVILVPDMRKNLVSGTFLNCVGYKQVYESGRYILSWCGVFIVFWYLWNLMFRLNVVNKISVVNYAFMSSSSSSKILA